MSEYFNHSFLPVYDKESQILILGSFPSVKSREEGFYYGHPRNRFWKVLAGILSVELPSTIEEKTAMLLKNHIAVYDVIESCEIEGSSDSSIRNVTPADIHKIVEESRIKVVFTNGKTAGRLYNKYQAKGMEMPMIELPSTSPANAAFSLEKLMRIWGDAMKEYLEDMKKGGEK